MGPTWVLSAPGGLHVGPMNLAIRDFEDKQIDLDMILPGALIQLTGVWAAESSSILISWSSWSRDRYLHP